MSSKCIEGIEIPWKEPCPVCGAYAFQPCGQHKKRLAAERAKKIADRVEERMPKDGSKYHNKLAYR